MPYKDIEKRRQAVRDSTRRKTERLAEQGLTSRGTPRKNAEPKHRLHDIDEKTRIAVCESCGPVNVYKQGKTYKGKTYWACAVKVREMSRRSHLKSAYNLTYEDLDRLLSECNESCQCCGTVFGIDGNLCVDHDHETGEVRGLLCRQCNIAFGMLGDNASGVRNLLKYAERFE